MLQAPFPEARQERSGLIAQFPHAGVARFPFTLELSDHQQAVALNAEIEITRGQSLAARFLQRPTQALDQSPVLGFIVGAAPEAQAPHLLERLRRPPPPDAGRTLRRARGAAGSPPRGQGPRAAGGRPRPPPPR